MAYIESTPVVTEALTQVAGNTSITPPTFAQNYQLTIVPSSGATGTAIPNEEEVPLKVTVERTSGGDLTYSNRFRAKISDK